ncbi:MAG: DUF2281 domain-containing protein [Thermoplasmatota archaeon]
MQEKELEARLRELPPEEKKEILDYVEFLLSRRRLEQGKKKFGFGWEGALKHIGDRYDAVELQHKSREWR